jgi:NADH:ubiquinone oxidoreductase subunit H
MNETLPMWLYIVAAVIKSAIVLLLLLTAVAYTVWLERKVVGHMQNRWGPTRVGPFGLLQPAADGLKFLFKEDLTPPHVYKPLFLAAPLIAVIFALTSIAVITFGNSITLFGYRFPLQVTDVNTGLLVILGVYRFMSEARALTNLIGNGVATIVVGRWTGDLDRERMTKELNGETEMVADDPEAIVPAIPAVLTPAVAI